MRLLTVVWVALGLLAMHGLGPGTLGHGAHLPSPAVAAAQIASSDHRAAHVAHSIHRPDHVVDRERSAVPLLADAKRLRDAGPGDACTPEQPAEHSAAHCIPAPGGAAPAPPAVVVLGRSDALAHAPAAAATRSAAARAPRPDLTQLSISRT